MPTVIEKIEALSERLERARNLVSDNRVHQVLGLPDHYVVQSASTDGFYMVNSNCTCPDARHRNELNLGLCKHKLAVVLYQDSPPEDDNPPHQLFGPDVIESLYGPDRELVAA